MNCLLVGTINDTAEAGCGVVVQFSLPSPDSAVRTIKGKFPREKVHPIFLHID